MRAGSIPAINVVRMLRGFGVNHRTRVTKHAHRGRDPLLRRRQIKRAAGVACDSRVSGVTKVSDSGTVAPPPRPQQATGAKQPDQNVL